MKNSPHPRTNAISDGRRDEPGSAFPEYGAKAFLLEMPVIGQRFGHAFAPHGLHGNAIRQAVAFVGPRIVEAEAIEERSPALRNDANVGIILELQHGAACG